MSFYCSACKRATDAYDLWPNSECVCCYTATEDVMARDAIYNPVFAP